MSFLKRPFRLGSLELANNIFYAPLAGCSDLPFRSMSRRYGPGLVFCEMVKIDALVRHDPNTYRLLDFTRQMHPIGAQLCGSKPELAGKAAQIIEEMGFDLIDLNCGCPVDKVTKDGSGSGLLRNPERIGEMLWAITSAVSLPVTVKIRVGWDDESIVCEEVTEIAERAGAKAITIHGRTREQGYTGPANWDHIRRCKEKARCIQVIGNGDVFDPHSAERLFATTGCDGILVARGTLGQPWIAEEIIAHLEGRAVPPKSVEEIRTVFLEHLEEIVHYQPERQALLDFRRVGSWYLKHCEGVKPLRMAIHRAVSTQEVFELVKQFEWEACALISPSALYAESL
jgi:nifR3 family TIM-barrel protein